MSLKKSSVYGKLKFIFITKGLPRCNDQKPSLIIELNACVNNGDLLKRFILFVVLVIVTIT